MANQVRVLAGVMDPVIVSFAPADATNPKTICTAPVEDAEVYNILIEASAATSASSIGVIVEEFLIATPATSFVLGRVTPIHTNQGNSDAAPMPLGFVQTQSTPSRLLDQNSNYRIPVKSGWGIRCRMANTLTGGSIKVSCIAAKY